MKEYIDREATLNERPEGRNPGQVGKEEYNKGWNDCRSAFYKCITSMPAADVVEVRHGRWNPEIHHTYIPVEYGQNGDPILHEYTSFRCSLCGREELKEEPYCHCGARMDKEDEHETD